MGILMAIMQVSEYWSEPMLFKMILMMMLMMLCYKALSLPHPSNLQSWQNQNQSDQNYMPSLSNAQWRFFGIICQQDGMYDGNADETIVCNKLQRNEMWDGNLPSRYCHVTTDITTTATDDEHIHDFSDWTEKPCADKKDNLLFMFLLIFDNCL